MLSNLSSLATGCRFNFEAGSNLIMAGTIQFAASIQVAKQQLAADFPSLTIPQSKPLSPGKLKAYYTHMHILPSLGFTVSTCDAKPTCINPFTCSLTLLTLMTPDTHNPVDIH